MNESAPRWPGTKGGPGLDFSPYRTSAGGAITKPGNTKNKRISAKQQVAKQAAAKAGEDKAKAAEQAQDKQQQAGAEQAQQAAVQEKATPQAKEQGATKPDEQAPAQGTQAKDEQGKAPAQQGKTPTQEQGKTPAQQAKTPTQEQGKTPAQQAKTPTQEQGKTPAQQAKTPTQEQGKTPAQQAKTPTQEQGKPQDKTGGKPETHDTSQPQGTTPDKQTPAGKGSEEPAKGQQATAAKTQAKQPDFKISPAQVNRAEKARQEWDATPVGAPSAPAAGSGAPAPATAPTVVKIPTKSQATEGDTEQKRTTRRTRKARLRLARVDPWSVMKTTFLFAIAFGVMMWVVTAVVWSVLASAGALDSLNETINKILGDAQNPFDITEIISMQRVLGFAAVVAVIDVVIITAVATLMAFLYNIAATVMGGLEVTLAED